LGHFAAIGIEDTVSEIRCIRVRLLYQQNLIATHAEMTISQKPNLAVAQYDALVDGIDNDKIITQAMHFAEFETAHVGNTCSPANKS
jgi:hypothetical protein